MYSLTFRHPVKSLFTVGIISNKYLVGAVIVGLLLQLIVMGVPVMQEAFKLQMLDSKGWLYVILLGLVPIVMNEIFKAIVRHRKKNNSHH
jgi:Ca2+-transporting ATPase